MKDFKKLSLVLILFFIFIIPLSPLAAETPYLHNEMPEYLQDFKETVARQVVEFPEVYFLSAVTEKKIVALTFDDGPDEVTTAELLDILQEEGIKATFFVKGTQVEKFPDLTERIVEEGHQIANHSWSHPDFRKLDNKEIVEDELISTSEIIKEYTGYYPKTLRPPYGAVTDENIEFLKERGWRIINWSIDSFDWDPDQNSPEEIETKINKYYHPGAIILMHCGQGREGTVEALPDIINNLREKGYQFLTVEELLLWQIISFQSV